MPFNIRNVTESFFASLESGDVERILTHYLTNAEQPHVFLEGPGWELKGVNRLREGWTHYFASGVAIKKCVWINDPLGDFDGEVAWAAGIVKVISTVQGKPHTLKLRGTYGLRLVDDRWLIVHEHFSYPLADPYGVGEWLPFDADPTD